MRSRAVDAIAGLLAFSQYRLYAPGEAVRQLPQKAIRWLVTRVFAARYRIQVLGGEHLPERGGVLLLGNHVSWLDWAVVQIASPRPVRFLIDQGIYERWYLPRLLDAFGVVPIAHGHGAEALQTVAEALNNGEAVCLFPEGQVTRTGNLSELKRGFERAAAEASGVIVPFYLHGLWGSRFSRAGAGLRRRRRAWPVRRVVVAMGEPLAMGTDATGVRQALMELSVASWQAQARALPPLAGAWLATAKRRARQRAVADSSDDWLSNRRLIAAVLAFAAYLRRNASGRRLGILLPPASAGIIANLAALLCGRAVVNLNYTAEPAAVRAAIERSGITDVITAGRFLRRLNDRGIDAEALINGLRHHDMEQFRRDLGRARPLLALGASFLPRALLERAFGTRPDPSATAAILFSSGSEGMPKGIELTHRNILSNCQQVTDVIDIKADDVLLGNLPLFHTFGLTVTTLLPAIEGVPVVCHPDPSDTVGSARTIAHHGVTLMCSTSTFLRLFTRSSRIHPAMLDSLRLIVGGAERLDPKVRADFEQRFTKRVYEGFGTTETAPVAAANLPDRIDPQDLSLHRAEKPGTVGMPLPGTAVRVVDPETNEMLPPGSDGMILIGGVQVMKGYLEDPERTREAIVELDGLRWYRTGDRGHVDADTFITVVDRYSRFAKIGGEMVSLTRVEDAVRQRIADPATELVAVNVPDPKKGERIVLLVAADADASEIATSIQHSEIHPLLVPAQTVSVPEIPKLGSGKLDIRAAQQLAHERAAG